MGQEQGASHVSTSIDWQRSGRQVGDIRINWSDDFVPLGYHSVPIVYFSNGQGPTVLLTGGVHGDEFVGPSSLMRLVQRIDPGQVNGKIILIPALNRPAVSVSTRNSPLDGANLNRAFPGSPTGRHTELIADYIENTIMPNCDAIIDLHAGGKASCFTPCTLVTDVPDKSLFEAGVRLAEAFGLPTLWILGAYNDSRSVNSAAARQQVPMIATELGGGGGTDPNWTLAAEQGIKRCLKYLGVMPSLNMEELGSMDAIQRKITIQSPQDSVFAPGRGLFDRVCHAGSMVKKGQLAGYLHWLEEPERPSLELQFPSSGYILAHLSRGMVNRGETLYLVTQLLG